MRSDLRDRLDAYTVFLILHGGMAFLLSVAFTLSMVYQVETVGLSPLELVLIGTILEGVYFVGEVPTGVVADVYSRRLSVWIGVFVLGISLIMYGAIPSFWGLAVAMVVMAIGYDFMSGAEQAWIVDELGEENAGQAFVRGSQMASIGTIGGAVVGVALGLVSLQLPLIAAGGAMLLLGVFLLLVMPEHGFNPVPRGERSSWHSMRDTFLDGSRLVRRKPILITIFGITAVFAAFTEGYDRLSTAHVLENFTLPDFGPFDPVVWFGAISIVTALLRLGVLQIVRRKVDMNSHQHLTKLLVGIDSALLLAVLGFALAGSFPLALGLMLATSVLRDLNYPLMAAWMNQSIDSRVRATVISMNGQTDAIGQVAGGPALGAIGNAFGVRAAIASAAMLLAPALLLFARALGQGEKPLVVVDEPQLVADG